MENNAFYEFILKKAIDIGLLTEPSYFAEDQSVRIPTHPLKLGVIPKQLREDGARVGTEEYPLEYYICEQSAQNNDLSAYTYISSDSQFNDQALN